MDANQILNKIRQPETLQLALNYVLRDRRKQQFFFDPIEQIFGSQHETAFIQAASEELQNINQYAPAPGFAYFPNKTSLCYRRMVHLPLKDQVIRYAFILAVADILDNDLSASCFANRRAREHEATYNLLQDFAQHSWPAWCTWQKEQSELHNCMLKTDISAFYDSVSHVHLVEAVSRSLSVPMDSPLIVLLKRMLKVPIESYSFLEMPKFNYQVVEQGLIIGSPADGFLANVYLKEIDEAMSRLPGITFARYNDDMRFFGKDKASLLHAVKVLQGMLLAKGLNLNAAKTSLAEGAYQMKELISKTYSQYFFDEEQWEDDEVGQASSLQPVDFDLDHPFGESISEFIATEEIQDDKTAKEFLKFMGNESRNPMVQWESWCIRNLVHILQNFPGAGRHGSALMVTAATNQDVPDEVRAEAQQQLLRLVEDPQTAPYIRYRLVHHLIRPNTYPYFASLTRPKEKDNEPKARVTLADLNARMKAAEFRTMALHLLPESLKLQLLEMAPKLWGNASFELDLMAMFLLAIAGKSIPEIEQALQISLQPPFGSPTLQSLTYLKSLGTEGLYEKWENAYPSSSLDWEPFGPLITSAREEGPVSGG